jgi:hypothetical protein
MGHLAHSAFSGEQSSLGHTPMFLSGVSIQPMAKAWNLFGYSHTLHPSYDCSGTMNGGLFCLESGGTACARSPILP